MSLKVIKNQGTPKQTSSEIELDLSGIPRGDQADVKEQIGAFLVEQIISSVGDEKSPVDGESWPKLSKKSKYRKFKQDEVGNQNANMELTGSLLDALTYKKTKSGISVGFYGKQAWKADGHLKFSGETNNTPQRRFIPAEGQEFKSKIQDEVDKIIIDAQLETSKIPTSELKEIETSSDLYSYFEDLLGLDSRSEIKMAILRNEGLTEQLSELGLLELL